MLKDKIFGNLKKVGQGTTCQVYNIGSCALKVINHTQTAQQPEPKIDDLELVSCMKQFNDTYNSGNVNKLASVIEDILSNTQKLSNQQIDNIPNCITYNKNNIFQYYQVNQQIKKIYNETKNIIVSNDIDNQIGFYQCLVAQYDAYIITKFVEGINLQDAIDKDKLTDIKRKMVVISNLCTLVVEMQLKGFVHRDIKPANVIWNYITDEVTMIDFGLTVLLKQDDDLMKTQAGTPVTVAPEVINGGKYHKECDIWSLGCTLFFIITGEWLITKLGNIKNKDDIRDIVFRIDQERIDHTVEYYLRQCDVPIKWISSIKSMLRKNEQERSIQIPLITKKAFKQ